MVPVLGLVPLPTLTSKICCDQPLDGRRKWQHRDTCLSRFWPWGRTSSRLRVCVVLTCTGGACRGGLQARWERRRSLQVPARIIEAKCQYRVVSRRTWMRECGWDWMIADARSCATAFSFYWPRGGSLQTCCMVLYTVSLHRCAVLVAWQMSWRILISRAAWWWIPASADGVAAPILCSSGDDFKGSLQYRV
jgi:hypothetical protein